MTGYLDFDLLLERQPEGYRARVVDSPAGQATATFRLPFSDLELENFLLRIGRPRRGVRRLEEPEAAAARLFGDGLFEAVFRDELRDRLVASLHEAQRSGRGLRIRLRTADVPELCDVPWEFLFNRSRNSFLSLSTATPLVRHLDLPDPVEPLAVTPPITALAVISSPADVLRLDVEGEWTRLSEALGDAVGQGKVALDRLDRPTLAALQRRLRRGDVHVLHFVGHGAFDESAQDGVLLFEDEEGRGRRVAAHHLGTVLHNHRPLRLVVLNACEGARSSRSDPFAGTAQSLVRQGVPAVVAMQFEITDAAALTFAHEIYGAIADGYPIDAALAEARVAMFAAGHGVEWATPVLYMRSPDGRLFEVEARTAPARQPVRISPSPVGVRAAPGGEAGFELRIHNPAPVPDRVALSVAGAASAWITLDPPVVSLPAGGEAVVRGRVRVVDVREAPAEPVRFAVRAASEADPSATAGVEGTVEVEVRGPAPSTRLPAPPATVRQRLAAALVDGTILLALIAIVLTALGATGWQDWPDGPYSRWGPDVGVTAPPMIIGLSLAYIVLFHGRDGRTPGKKVMGLRVLLEDTRSGVPYGRAFLRSLPLALFGWAGQRLLLRPYDVGSDLLTYLVTLVPALGNLLWSLRDPRGRTWFDHLAGTFTVTEAEGEARVGNAVED